MAFEPDAASVPATEMISLGWTSPEGSEDRLKLIRVPPPKVRLFLKVSAPCVVLEPGVMVLVAEVAVITVPVTVPLPERVWPARRFQPPGTWDTSKVEPDDSVTEGTLEIEPVAPNASVPALMATAPPEVFVPANVQVPVPHF